MKAASANFKSKMLHTPMVSMKKNTAYILTYELGLPVLDISAVQRKDDVNISRPWAFLPTKTDSAEVISWLSAAINCEMFLKMSLYLSVEVISVRV